MKKYHLLLQIFIGVLLFDFADVMAQDPTSDSLILFLKTSPEDTSKVNALNTLSKQYTNSGDYEKAMQYAKQAEQAATNINHQKGLANSYNNIGVIYWSQANYDQALKNYLKSLEIRQAIGDKKGIATSYNNVGLVYYDQGNYEKALQNQLKALKIREEIGDKKGLAMSFNNIGMIYNYQGDYKNALEKYFKSVKIKEEIGDRRGIAATELNIGMAYFNLKNYEKALDIYFKSLKIREEMGDKQGIEHLSNNIGNIYLIQKNYGGALEKYFTSLKIQLEIGDILGAGTSYNNIGTIYTKQNKFNEASNYLNQALTIFKKIGYKEGTKATYVALSDLYNKKGDFKEAYHYHKLYSDIKDTLLNEQSSKQIAEMNVKYDSEKKDKELIKKDAEISKHEAETEKQNLQRNAFIIGFSLMLVLAFFIYRGYRQKKSANKLLGEKNSVIEKQKKVVEEKNEKITDSINYAKRIQQAILPSDELIKLLFPDSFIFFQPKDIVSGDFYWLSEKKDKILIAVADCTGHGVPGAFMSMIGNTLLNEIVNVKNIIQPAQILSELNQGIVNLLNQSNTDSSTQDDGMDITIVSIDKINNEIEFAGANHFSYLIDQNQLQTLEGDVYSIGGMFGKADINFTSQKIKVNKGSTLYLFTDGFIDQFGGEKNTKYLSGRFNKLLQRIQVDNMESQKEELITEFNNWKINTKQLDDVLVVGIRI
ncbi:MAG: tetratricopeptide repeat protein [Bacteroidota bacterium]